MIDIVRQFATDLATFESRQTQAGEALKREVTEQLTAVRHDVFASVAYLSQQSVDMKNAIEDQRTDSIDWRSTERAARQIGQHGYRILVITSLVLSCAALVVSLAVAAALIVKVF